MAAMNFIREAAGALAGLLAGAVALGVAELTAAATGARGAPVVAVGEAAINFTPVPVKESRRTTPRSPSCRRPP
jgi:hypothetical protein